MGTILIKNNTENILEKENFCYYGNSITWDN